MISRVYSGEGQMIDEFARERRLFTPIEDIPPLLREAFAELDIRHLASHDDVVREGAGHNGMSALIDLVAVKP